MNKRLLKIIGLILIMFSSGITAYATTAYIYKAEEIGYNNHNSNMKDANGNDVENMKEAVNELYDESIRHKNLNTQVNDIESYLNDEVVVEVKTKDNIVINASANKLDTFDVSKNGYKPIAIGGFKAVTCNPQGSYASVVNTNILRMEIPLGTNNVEYNFANYATKQACVKLDVYVIYVKNK